MIKGLGQKPVRFGMRDLDENRGYGGLNTLRWVLEEGTKLKDLQGWLRLRLFIVLGVPSCIKRHPARYLF